MGFLKEFKDFAMKGNVIDLAVGIVIGTAFNKIVSSFVNDIIMPPIGLLLGNADFTQLYINLSNTAYNTMAEAVAAGAPIIKYGNFISTIIDFLIIALAVFVAIKFINKLNKTAEERALKLKEKIPIKDLKEKFKGFKKGN
jgi:large conductance mechanosensitive channel